MAKLIEFLSNILEWLLEALLWVPHKLYELVLEGLAGVIEAIPVPDFLSNLSGWAAAIDPSVAYFAAAFQLGAGVTIIISAYVLRFLIRRIPIIG